MLESYKVTNKNGTVTYYKDPDHMILHRLDGPAIERPDGAARWYVDNKRHRLDGPAITYPDGDKEWYANDRLHRLDGPAIEYADGEKEWFVNGRFLCMLNKRGKLIDKMDP